VSTQRAIIVLLAIFFQYFPVGGSALAQAVKTDDDQLNGSKTLERDESVVADDSDDILFDLVHYPLNANHGHAHPNIQYESFSKPNFGHHGSVQLQQLFSKNKSNSQIASQKLNASSNSSVSNSTCGSTGSDGEGCAQILDITSLSAGEDTSFTLRFTAGATGIPVGGGISVGLHHASSWPTQIASPDRHGYVDIDSNNADNFSLEHHVWAPAGMLSRTSPPRNPDWIFHNVIIAKVKNQSVLPGETIDFVFGANSQKLRTQRYADPDHEFRVTTDIDGDGFYAGIVESPKIAVVHAEGSSLSATAPSQAAVGQSFDVMIRVEDDNYNVDKSYQGSVTLRDENGSLVANNIQLVNGIGRGAVTLNSLGPHRLRIASSSGDLSGRSNPIRVFQSLPETGLYWADLHGHTGVSDGLGKDANEYFEFGRDVAALDIIALTDHGHNDWPANIQAVKDHYEPGKYVTILALEGGGPTSHTNLYYRRDDADYISNWPRDYPTLLDRALNQYNSDISNPEVLAGPHHFTYEVGSTGEHLYPFGQ